jgi:hypothetical protein
MSFNFVHDDKVASMGICDRICFEWPSERRSLTRAGPIFLSLDNVVLGKRCSVGAVGSFKIDVPTGIVDVI